MGSGWHTCHSDPANEIWKRYRGGEASEIWLATLSDASIERVPRDGSNDASPMWIGSTVYFLSDRNGPTTLFKYDTQSKQVTQVVENHGLDIKSASAGPDAIVYEQFGSLYLFDPGTQKSAPVPVTVTADLPRVRPHFVPAAPFVANADLSPTGARAVFEARGEIITVPADKGDARDLTNTTGTMERDPAWSPDGRSVAYFSDASGEYTLHIQPQSGGAARSIVLGDAPSYYYSPKWSPDSKKISYLDKRYGPAHDPTAPRTSAPGDHRRVSSPRHDESVRDDESARLLPRPLLATRHRLGEYRSWIASRSRWRTSSAATERLIVCRRVLRSHQCTAA